MLRFIGWLALLGAFGLYKHLVEPQLGACAVAHATPATQSDTPRERPDATVDRAKEAF